MPSLARATDRIVAVILYVLAALLFALVIATVTQQRLSYANDPYNVRMGEVNSFCLFHRVPRGLQDKLTSYFESMCATHLTYLTPPPPPPPTSHL